jgi:hypothetical protein
MTMGATLHKIHQERPPSYKFLGELLIRSIITDCAPSAASLSAGRVVGNPRNAAREPSPAYSDWL